VGIVKYVLEAAFNHTHQYAQLDEQKMRARSLSTCENVYDFSPEDHIEDI
jgi:hypothetical protein